MQRQLRRVESAGVRSPSSPHLFQAQQLFQLYPPAQYLREFLRFLLPPLFFLPIDHALALFILIVITFLLLLLVQLFDAFIVCSI